ncbi:hypothetical protein BTZ20_0796 [Rhodococcus sp. MTM3W5.2]|nr:hypothetical protein BTZ20_0796 [Rhodococcus sp. MTM3W5.2]
MRLEERPVGSSPQPVAAKSTIASTSQHLGDATHLDRI